MLELVKYWQSLLYNEDYYLLEKEFEETIRVESQLELDIVEEDKVERVHPLTGEIYE
ncbi:MAG: hypothetical protein Unbinned96contig1001_19 [Prokaryotic dsDNA virus sp.]|nr:MAG: hypothetical protein Unbinned96contig1001_19 [Prokaryotic dsDNA virus sp.]|tara:strand:+ start:2416 stop:2586 length:171 start_codon:yes stop_codon:yes gene_type:complete